MKPSISTPSTRDEAEHLARSDLEVNALYGFEAWLAEAPRVLDFEAARAHQWLAFWLQCSLHGTLGGAHSAFSAQPRHGCEQVARVLLPWRGEELGHWRPLNDLALVHHGDAGFRTFSAQKSVFRQSRLSGIGLFKPPYGKLFERLIRLLLH